MQNVKDRKRREINRERERKRDGERESEREIETSKIIIVGIERGRAYKITNIHK